MLVSFSRLKEFVDIECGAAEIGDLLTMGGIEVEAVTRVGVGLDRVLTARITEISPHPSAEGLHLARISLGANDLTVVCGAPNIRVGQVVPYAAPGALLPSGLEISEREIKGVRSPGMLCSEREIGLGDDASGVLVFDPDTPTGMPLAKAMPFIEDEILEVSVTPNRGDCLSVLGLAGETAALLGTRRRMPEFTLDEVSTRIRDHAVVEVPDYDLCPRYVARMVEGVKVGPSPFGVRLMLYRSGIRPISNVVDATNLILMECGQPLHAFDFSLLEEGKIVVRRCDPGETFVTLDGQERKLPENALMIRDGKRSVALAGIMGGLNSEIHKNTSTVLIESACFERFGIRRTAKALGMSTEASFRFERGIDPDGTLWAAHRAAYVIAKLAGGRILSGCLDVYPEPIRRPKLTMKAAKANGLLGTDLSLSQMASYLNRLGIEVPKQDRKGTELTAIPPSWRWDLEREVDLIEEVARIHGFQNIPLSMPRCAAQPDRTHESLDRIRAVNSVMNACGYTEIITMSFVSRQAAEEFAAGTEKHEPLALLNPLSEDLTVMRTSLIPGLLSAMKRNVSFRSEDLRLYELGKTFSPVPGQELPREDLVLAGLASGARYPLAWNLPSGEEVDFYDVKGALETLFDSLGVTDVTYAPSEDPLLHPGKSADVFVAGVRVGIMGELSPEKMRQNDLARRVQIFEILVEPLFIHGCKKRVFRPLPRYPYVERDLSIVAERNCSGDQIKHLISRLGHAIITSVILFDLYRGESIPEGCQSMAFRIRYQSEDRTLTDEEVQEVHARVVEAVSKEFGATMRA